MFGQPLNILSNVRHNKVDGTATHCGNVGTSAEVSSGNIGGGSTDDEVGDVHDSTSSKNDGVGECGDGAHNDCNSGNDALLHGSFDVQYYQAFSLADESSVSFGMFSSPLSVFHEVCSSSRMPSFWGCNLNQPMASMRY